MCASREGKIRWTLAVPLLIVSLLVVSPTALAAGSPGAISGTVTSACLCEDFAPLKNIEVTVYEASASELPVGFATTNAKGEYTVEGLAAGFYKVEFSPEFESGLNFVTQFYKEKSSLATAEEVEVVEGKTKEGIDAELQVGAKIEGTVTDASTHAALPYIEVTALGADKIPAAFAITNATGQYTIAGLANGSYAVRFTSGHYITQYFNDQPSFASANTLTVVQEKTATGINAALVPKEPVNTVAPVVSGAPAVGHALSCSSGTWTGSPTLAYTYAWLRAGSPIAGASASTYVVQQADQGKGIACKVTATNRYGSSHAVSNTLTVPAAPVAPLKLPPPPEVVPLASKIAVSEGSARVPLLCANANCTGTIELIERIVRKRHRGGKTISSRETLVLGKGLYALLAGHSATIDVDLTAAGRHALARARHHRLRAGMYVSAIGGATVRAAVVLSEITPHKHRRGHR
jgi:Carboxypeptidase regulatory-like domain